MIRAYGVLLAALFLLAAGLASEIELTPSQKEKLIKAIGNRLEKKAFAYNTDFSEWEKYALDSAEEIQAASTKEEVAKALGGALDKFELSHLGIFAPSTIKLQRAGQRTGIGISLHPQDEGGALISYVMADSPAERCGLQKGDMLIRVDGHLFTDIQQLAGLVGQKRNLTWIRGEEKLSCQIEYAPFFLSEKSSMKWLSDDVALIQIQSFQYRFYQAHRINRFFREARQAKAIIIDLRNNRGGLSFYSRHLASKFTSPTETFALLAKSNESVPHRLYPVPLSKPYKGKVVVLVDSLSASAADIVPAFVSESKRGLVIGQKTSGALQLAKSYSLPYGFRIYLPIAEMLTPEGNRLEASGFMPDIELSLQDTIKDDAIFKVALRTIDETYELSE